MYTCYMNELLTLSIQVVFNACGIMEPAFFIDFFIVICFVILVMWHIHLKHGCPLAFAA